MWNKKDGYLSKQEKELCFNNSVTTKIQILKIYAVGYRRFMWFTIDNIKDYIYKVEINHNLYKQLKEQAKIYTSQQLRYLKGGKNDNNNL